MTNSDIKELLIGKISGINDGVLLDELLRIIDQNHEDSNIYRLSSQHAAAVSEAIQQIADGEYITNEDSNLEVSKWLKK
jgi:hypothetical protein